MARPVRGECTATRKGHWAMGHNRKLVLGGVALVRARLPNDVQALSNVRDELEAMLIETRFLDGAPFKWISLIIKYGLEDASAPVYKKISVRHGDLPLSIEIDTQRIVGASVEETAQVFCRAATAALRHVAKKYNLPVDALERYAVSRSL